MNTRLRTTQWLFAAVTFPMLLAACAGGEPAATARPGPVTFRAVVPDTAEGAYWVQLNTESEPVAWLRVTFTGEPVHVTPRCEIPDCGRPPAVCGAALPRATRLRPGDSLSFTWNGEVSTFSTSEGPTGTCERRETALPGNYTAEMCYATRMIPLHPDKELTRDTVIGFVHGAVCLKQTFTVPGPRLVEIGLTPQETS